MWAQEWQNMYDLLIPFKSKTNVDITPALKSNVSKIIWMVGCRLIAHHNVIIDAIYSNICYRITRPSACFERPRSSLRLLD